MQAIRLPLGYLILGVSKLTQPRAAKHSPEQQAVLDAATADLQLYQFKLCPFCVKTRRAIHRLGLNIELRDAQGNAQWREELLTQGGKIKVPSLRIEDEGKSTTWLYESNEIIAYLDGRFA